MTGSDTVNTWALGGSPTFNDGSNSLSFSGFANLSGGTLADTFNVTAASAFNLDGGSGNDVFDIDAALTGSVTGDTGSDTLQGDVIDAVTLTSSATDGYAGGESDVSLGFGGIKVLTGSGGTLTGSDTVNNWAAGGWPALREVSNSW